MDPVSISIEFNSSRSELSIEVCCILGLSKALKFGKNHKWLEILKRLAQKLIIVF
jgi:hypothetical protein